MNLYNTNQKLFDIFLYNPNQFITLPAHTIANGARDAAVAERDEAVANNEAATQHGRNGEAAARQSAKEIASVRRELEGLAAEKGAFLSQLDNRTALLGKG